MRTHIRLHMQSTETCRSGADTRAVGFGVCLRCEVDSSHVSCSRSVLCLSLQIQLELTSSPAQLSLWLAVDFVYPQVVIFCETISRRIAFCCRRLRRRRRVADKSRFCLLLRPLLLVFLRLDLFAWALLIAFPDFGCKGIIMLRMRPVRALLTGF